ncbi:uncharacterized protein BP5553_01143 [Venustampulla echinocandica]|uniref:Uncharacterized protein n=1 Tax=Venustampulla echinocandica TaxID=2656787 RepID=A0A370U075_9HELO|nr:uncharacterized protein BP5553_01143 [Venustampulla echinocandica]RDL41164.1 hypothetical protein BP5553_01143 [Venustampulla echinocandica]
MSPPRFIGICRVDISSLKFVYGSRDVDRRIVENLKRIFKKTKCKKDKRDTENHLLVLVSTPELNRALKTSRLTLKSLKVPQNDGPLPVLKVSGDQKLLCLQGKHRVRAADEFFLDPKDKWWTIRLFSADLKEEADITLVDTWRDQFYHQAAFSDGEIYRKVRFYKTLGQDTEVDTWTIRLSDCKQVGLRQLLKRESFAKGFDSLLHFPGLWAGLELGNIQKHLALRCDEEVTRYLSHILTVWSDITMGIEEVEQAVDIQTVESLQLRCPRVCTADKNFVIQAMSSGLLFPKILNGEIRRDIQDRILDTGCFVPSIKSMHENLKYLAEGAKILRQLVLGDDIGWTIKRSLEEVWAGHNNGVIEVAAGNFNLAYKQLWMSALRNFADLGGRSPRKEENQKPYKASSNPRVHYEFAQEALQLGFGTNSIYHLLARDPRGESLRLMFKQLYDRQSTAAIETLVQEVLSKLPAPQDPVVLDLSSSIETSDAHTDLSRRWGVPFEYAYQSGKAQLFISHMHQEPFTSLTGVVGASFARRDFITSFFGPTSDFKRNIENVPKSDELFSTTVEQERYSATADANLKASWDTMSCEEASSPEGPFSNIESSEINLHQAAPQLQTPRERARSPLLSPDMEVEHHDSSNSIPTDVVQPRFEVSDEPQQYYASSSQARVNIDSHIPPIDKLATEQIILDQIDRIDYNTTGPRDDYLFEPVENSPPPTEGFIEASSRITEAQPEPLKKEAPSVASSQPNPGDNIADVLQNTQSSRPVIELPSEPSRSPIISLWSDNENARIIEDFTSPDKHVDPSNTANQVQLSEGIINREIPEVASIFQMNSYEVQPPPETQLEPQTPLVLSTTLVSLPIVDDHIPQSFEDLPGDRPRSIMPLSQVINKEDLEVANRKQEFIAADSTTQNPTPQISGSEGEEFTPGMSLIQVEQNLNKQIFPPSLIPDCGESGVPDSRQVRIEQVANLMSIDMAFIKDQVQLNFFEWARNGQPKSMTKAAEDLEQYLQDGRKGWVMFVATTHKACHIVPRRNIIHQMMKYPSKFYYLVRSDGVEQWKKEAFKKYHSQRRDKRAQPTGIQAHTVVPGGNNLKRSPPVDNTVDIRKEEVQRALKRQKLPGEKISISSIQQTPYMDKLVGEKHEELDLEYQPTWPTSEINQRTTTRRKSHFPQKGEVL